MPFVPLGFHDEKPDYNQVIETNPDHPLAEGLVVNWHGGSEPLVNLVNTSASNIGTLNGTRPPRSVTVAGMGSSFPGTSDHSIDIGAPTWIDTTEPFTFACYADWNDANESFPVVANFKTNSDAWRLFFSDNASYSQCSFGSDATWIRLRTGASSFAKNTPGIVVVRYNGAAPGTAGNYDAMINGVDVTLTTAAAFGAATLENVIGKQGSFDYEGNLYGVRLWQNLRLDDESCRALCTNFWLPFDEPLELPPAPVSVYFEEGAAPSGDVRPRFYHHRHHNRAA